MLSKQNHPTRARSVRTKLLIASLVALAGFAPNAFAAQWVETGRMRHILSESIAPYALFWNNNCQGGVVGPSGVYTYWDIGPEGYGSCSTDQATGWANNVEGNYGFCRPDLESLGSGTYCEDRMYTVIGQGQYQGQLPAACNVPGTYAIAYRRQVQLIDFGVGSQPNDYYEEVQETNVEYYCQ